jgi:uncharacterized protein (DUF302 family)
MESESVAFSIVTDLSYETAVERCREALAAEGFGVLTEIDVQATFKKKLDVDRPPYLILGACHPPSAYKALTAAPEAGVLLPCNVTVSVEDGQTVVRAMNPGVALGVLQAEGLGAVAEDVGEALQRAVQAVASTV